MTSRFTRPHLLFSVCCLGLLLASCTWIVPTTPASEGMSAPTRPALASTVVASSQPRRAGTYPSPDGRWQAEVLIYDCVATAENQENAYDQLNLIAASNDQSTVIADQLQSCGSLGAAGLAGLFWSPNSRFFYYTDAREGVPDGCGYWAGSILRYDTQMQATVALGGGLRSPDGMKIATRQGEELVIWDVDQGEIIRQPVLEPKPMSGPLVWAPDSQALVYLQLTNICPPVGQTAVVRLDLPDGQQTLLLTSEAPTFQSVLWTSADQLELYDEDSQAWRYNFTTQTLTPP